MASRPTQVKIGASAYSLVISKPKWNMVPEQEKVAGYTDLHSHTIYVDPSMSDANIKNTALHEVLHALFDDSGATWPLPYEEMEETIIRILTPRLAAFIRENPEFMEWVSE